MVEALSRPESPVGFVETEGLDRLYREQAPRMWRALTAFSGSRDIAQDAVAEAFAQAIRRGEAIHSPERWVWRAAYRIAAGELHRRRPLLPLTLEGPTLTEEPAWELRSALAELPAQQRAALVLHYYAGYPASDIARITGSTAAGVWMSLSRGRQRLRRLLEVADD